MDLAKAALDVGLYTNRRAAQLAFWGDEVGLAYDELHKTGGGVHQHRPAYISFVRSPDGDWLEVSQRASLTGPLPDTAPRR